MKIAGSFRERVAWTLGARGISIVVALLSSIVTARWLGPEGRGILVTLSVITGMALQFGNLGLHSGNVYFVAREPERTGSILGNTLWLSVGLGLAAGLATLGVAWARPDWLVGIPYALILVTVLVLPFQFMILFFQNTLLGMHQVAAFNLLEIGQRIVAFLMIATYLIGFSGGASGTVVLLALVGSVGGIASVVLAARRAPIRLGFDAPLFGRMIRYGGRVYLACLFSFLVIRSDLLLVNYFLGTSSAGVYSIAAQIADVLLLVPVTIGMILMPRIAAGAPENSEAVTARVTRHAALIMSLLCGAAFVLVGPVVDVLYGAPFREAIAATRWLLPGIWALGINGILMNHYAGRGLPWVAVVTPFCGLVVNVTLNLVLIPSIGLVGAAAASTVAYALMFCIAMITFVRSGKAGLRETIFMPAGEVVGLLRLRA
jgi:O-antigen/teichoic acid export membrane protein